tara:strand:- start:114 stop:428 length:315 start_codon:yes stop_codon:yes gene_type:complete
MTVYVTQENPRADIVSATKWGELKPLSSPTDQVHINPERMVKQVKKKLAGFNDDDFLLAMGDPAIIGISFAIAAHFNEGRVAMLKWDKLERMYYEVLVNIFEQD